ncbi:MAG: hypothetical protein ACOC2H_06420 [Spirochaetota bacterium]
MTEIKPEVLIIYGAVILLVIGIIIGYRIFRKRMNKKMEEQKALVNQHKMPASIFVIEKKKGKISEAKLPKSVVDQVPAIYKLRKMPLVTAKIGPQVVTLVCEDDIFDKLPEKKNINVELAGIFIVSIKTAGHTKGQKQRKSKRKKR